MEEKLNKTIDLLVECAKNCEKFDEEISKDVLAISAAIGVSERVKRTLKKIEAQISEIENEPVYDKYQMDVLETLYKKQKDLEWLLYK